MYLNLLIHFRQLFYPLRRTRNSVWRKTGRHDNRRRHSGFRWRSFWIFFRRQRRRVGRIATGLCGWICRRNYSKVSIEIFEVKWISFWLLLFFDCRPLQKEKRDKHNAKIPILTNTTLTVLRQMGKYLQMSRLLKPIAYNIIMCMNQLFDYYLYAVHSFFTSDLVI